MIRNLPWIAAALLCLVATAAAPESARTPDATALAQLDGFALGMAEAGAFSGVVLVAKGDRVVFEKAYGPRDPGSDNSAAATIDTRYDIASAGKMFAATAILQLVGAGKLSLDDTVGAVLKDYPNRAVADHVTIRQLLTHTDGTGGSDVFGVENTANRAKVHSVADLIALNARQTLQFAPGSEQDYDNFGFVILGRIVEILSGEDYATYV